jgi:flagellar biosynthesis anti-sigma factor FlgM
MKRGNGQCNRVIRIILLGMILHNRCEMDIKKIGPYADHSADKLQEKDLRTTEQTRAPSTRKKSPTEASDRLEFSRGYQEMDKLKKVIMGMADIRVESVDHYRNTIPNGTYTVNPSQLACKILDEHLSLSCEYFSSFSR